MLQFPMTLHLTIPEIRDEVLAAREPVKNDSVGKQIQGSTEIGREAWSKKNHILECL